MRLTAQVGVPTPPPDIPQPPPALSWGAIALAIAWIAPRLWRYFEKREADEADLLKLLISDLRESNSALIADAKAGREQLLEQIQLKQEIRIVSAILKDDVQRALSSQASMYANLMERAARLENMIDALHRRLDDVQETIARVSVGDVGGVDGSGSI